MHAVLASAARTSVRVALALVMTLGAALVAAPGAGAAAYAPREPSPAPLAVARAAALDDRADAEPAEDAEEGAAHGPEHAELELARLQPRMNVARVLFASKATARPGARGRLLARLGPLAPFGGGPAQFRVTAQKVVEGRLYVRILLPRRPNGIQGWIPGDDVELSRTDYAVTIDTRARRVSVSYRGRRVNAFSAVVGRPESPTPRGSFAITELIQQFPSTRFLGSWVVPLTAYSGTYMEFKGGPGLVAIHGRGADALHDPLGSAASHGCVRIDNADVNWMANRLQPGVPVTVR